MVSAGFATLLFAAAIAAAAPADEAGVATGNLPGEVLRIFEAKCVECHASDSARPGGDFDYVLDLPRIADNPDYLIRGDPDKSEI